MKKMNCNGRYYTNGMPNEMLIGHIGFGEKVVLDFDTHKKVLVTGSGSYIGNKFQYYAKKYDVLHIDSIDMHNDTWKDVNFSQYDIVFHVAGIAHSDISTVDDKTKEKYYKVNTDLAVDVCDKAKREGVKAFIFMSSMIVYGEAAPFGKKKTINEHTVPMPSNFYGDSKLQADVAVRRMADDGFKVIVMRPPMIYGNGSKGNYQLLAKIARQIPLFPNVDNQRSMLYIDDFCELLCQIMLIKEIRENAVVLIPQNKEWCRTSEIVKIIATSNGNKIFLLKIFRPIVSLCSIMPGRIGVLTNKAFGNFSYSLGVSIYPGINYQQTSIHDSIKKTENGLSTDWGDDRINDNKRALILASVASMIDQFNMNNIKVLKDCGYNVDVACNFIVGNNCSSERIHHLLKLLKEMNVNAYQVDFSRNVFNLFADIKSLIQVNRIVQGKAESINNARIVFAPYNLIHSHSPIGGIVGRIISKKNHIYSIYTAHGFHFFNGGSLLNWVLFYPIEKIFSKYTDVLLTINDEDYLLSKKKFFSKEVYRIPSVGIDVENFDLFNFDTFAYRKKLGLSPNDYMILSVGELNNNKNHSLVIRTIAKMKDSSVHYYIVGVGRNMEKYYKLSELLGISEQIHLLGFRTDVAELNYCADVFALPSKREGLGVAALEALSCGTPVCGMNTRGIREYVIDGITGYLFNNNIDECKEVLIKCRGMKTKLSPQCKEVAKNYSSDKTEKIMEQIYMKARN